MLRRLVNVKEHEASALLWSFSYFFCVLCSYYILRPVRDELGIQSGVENLQWLFTGTFAVMLLAVPLFGWASARLPRRRLLPVVYLFFVANLLVFWGLFESGIAALATARAFFIWVSVFNLFVVSVFWSFMADLYSNEQARRLFGFIAAGGSTGGLVGPTLTAALVPHLGIFNLLLLSAALLALALVCIARLARWGGDTTARTAEVAPGAALGGGVLAGVQLLLRSPYLAGLCLFVLLYTMLATFLYLQQAHIVRDAFSDPAIRTQFFARMDLAVNTLTIFGQVFLSARLIAVAGLPLTLALLPAFSVLAFAALALAPGLAVLIVIQVLRRAAGFAITGPAREVLFTVVTPEEKYKCKNFIDTFVSRGSDTLSTWLFALLAGVGLGLSGVALVAVPLALAWGALAFMLGRKQERLRAGLDQR